VGTTVGQHHFTDLTYADDAAIFMSDVTQAASTLQSFNTIAASLGLRISWAKTKLQNVGASNPPTTLSLDGAPIEGVEEFIYLGSKQSSSGYGTPWVNSGTIPTIPGWLASLGIIELFSSHVEA